MSRHARPSAAPAANLRPFYRHFYAGELKEALRRMYLIRRFEEGAEDAYTRGLIHGTMHLSIGQEASAVGACMDLRKTRLHHLDPSRPWPLHRQGRRSQADVRRILRQGRGLLPRPWRLHAHCRCRKRQSRRQWHCRRRHSDRGWCRARHQEAEARRCRHCASSATAPPMKAPSTRRSTWRRSGNCRCCSSARTTNTACRFRPSAPWR